MNLTPLEIVSELDKHVVGQAKAKRAVAIALRNRWRRQQVDEPLRHEITPKNILMIGPTGVGQTEIARRLARLADAPFIKIEATKFTEVGYVGRDVDTIIRDLIDIGIKQTRASEAAKVRQRAEDAAEDRIIDILVPPARDFGFNVASSESKDGKDGDNTRQTFRKRLREGALDEREIEIEVADAGPQMEIMAPPGMEEMTEQIKGMFSGMGAARKKAKKLKIKDAIKILIDEEAGKLINEDEMKQKAISNVEQNGIDMGCPMSTTLRAPADGVVAYEGRFSGYGNMLMLQSSQHMTLVFGHLKSFIAKKGQSVKRGQVIALTDNTGWSTGPHLHFEVRIDSTPKNPFLYLGAKP